MRKRVKRAKTKHLWVQAPIDPRIQEEIKKLFRFFAKDHDAISFP